MGRNEPDLRLRDTNMVILATVPNMLATMTDTYLAHARTEIDFVALSDVSPLPSGFRAIRDRV